MHLLGRIGLRQRLDLELPDPLARLSREMHPVLHRFVTEVVQCLRRNGQPMHSNAPGRAPTAHPLHTAPSAFPKSGGVRVLTLVKASKLASVGPWAAASWLWSVGGNSVCSQDAEAQNGADGTMDHGGS